MYLYVPTLTGLTYSCPGPSLVSGPQSLLLAYLGYLVAMGGRRGLYTGDSEPGVLELELNYR